MFFRPRRKRPYPTGSGDFIENVRWWFWDDATTPGLMTSDAFSRLCQEALTHDEWGKLCVAQVQGRVASMRRRNNKLPSLPKDSLQKVGAHLRAIRDNDPEAFDQLIPSKWTRADVDGPMLDVLKAYINVIESWGYLFSWQIIKDALDTEAALLVLTDGRPSHFIVEYDVREVNGRPHEFSIWMNGKGGVGTETERRGGGNWHFHYEDGGFDMKFFEYRRN